jgi:predicted nucleic acid-binding protein
MNGTIEPQDSGEPDGRRSLDVVQVILNSLISTAVSAAIRMPDEYGAFPPTAWPVHWFPVPPLVADANVLRNDILYSCRKQQRTTLVTAANAGVLRLFCASHVPEEIEEHAGKWAHEGRADPDDFLRRWRHEYVPLLRRVEVPFQLLTDLEVEALEVLYNKDPDDVPSASLARLLGAFFLSEDGHALKAVYGPEVDTERHHAWLAAIRSGSSSAQISGVVNTAVIFPAIFGQGILDGGKRLYNINPWLLAGAAAGAGTGGYLLWRSKNERVQRVRSGAWRFLEYLADVAGQLVIYMSECEVTFNVMFPTVPGWEDLSTTHRGEDVLARSCLYELAREPSGNLSAVQMHEKLPFHLPGNEKAIREVFREYECFERVGRGRWQVGSTWAPSSAVKVTEVSAVQVHSEPDSADRKYKL